MIQRKAMPDYNKTKGPMNEIGERGSALAAPAALWPRSPAHWLFRKVVLPSGLISLLAFYYIGLCILIQILI